MTAREDLIVTISDALLASAQSDKYGLNAVTEADLEAFPVADALLAAGYSKPRIVSTVEDLEALPNYSVIADNDDDIWQKRGGEWCSYETSPHTSARLSKYVPLAVLHEGEVTL